MCLYTRPPALRCHIHTRRPVQLSSILRALGAMMEMYTPLNSENNAFTVPHVLVFDPLSMTIARDNFLSLASEVGRA